MTSQVPQFCFPGKSKRSQPNQLLLREKSEESTNSDMLNHLLFNSTDYAQDNAILLLRGKIQILCSFCLLQTIVNYLEITKDMYPNHSEFN